MALNNSTVVTEDITAILLELAANNDVEGFKHFMEYDFSCIDAVGLWHVRPKGSEQLVLLQRTPLMVASTCGSVDVVNLITSFSDADVNKSCGVDKTTALHCAASSGSLKAISVVKLLLKAGANPNLVDANGNFPVDVIPLPLKLGNFNSSLEELLSTDVSNGTCNLRVLKSISNSNSGFPSSPLDSNPSPESSRINDVLTIPYASASEINEYPVDPAFPGITTSMYLTDEFRMFSFKVHPCSRSYSHDWTECPFVHPGENARRRDPRKYHYSCVPCPDFRKGACQRGDMCEYAHGVFESWLHPAQYKTRICKDGMSCNRRVCFFAHSQEELRPLYVSTSSAVPSPRSGSTNDMDFAAAMSQFPNLPSSSFTPLSPSANGISSMGWAQQNVPALHLPGSSLQASLLRSSLNARDIQSKAADVWADFNREHQQYLNELARLSQPSQIMMNLNHSKSLTAPSLDDIFSADSSSLRYSEPGLASAVFSPTHKTAILNQFQQHKNMLSPINTSFSPKSVDRPLMQSPFAAPSSGRMSSLRGVDSVSPMGSRGVSMPRDKQPMNFESLSSRDLGGRSAAAASMRGDSWSNWSNTSGEGVWTANADEFGKLPRSSSSFQLSDNVEEPDLGWVHSLVWESPEEMLQSHRVVDGTGSSGECSSSNHLMDPTDQSVLGECLEKMQLDK